MARVAIMTGGASRIGRALSAALVRRGDRVVLADLDRDAVSAVAEQLNSQGLGQPAEVRGVCRGWGTGSAVSGDGSGMDAGRPGSEGAPGSEVRRSCWPGGTRSGCWWAWGVPPRVHRAWDRDQGRAVAVKILTRVGLLLRPGVAWGSWRW